MFLVKPVSFLNPLEINLDPKPWPVWNAHLPVHDLERVLRKPLAILPDPVSVDGSDFSRGRGRGVRDHGERDIEVII